MKILIFIEHSFIVRHFIHSKAFSLIAKKHELVYVLPFGHKRLGKLKKKDLNVECKKIINLPVNQKRVSLWGRRFSVELLRSKNICKNLRKNRRMIFKSHNPNKLYYLYRFLGLPVVFNFFTFLINQKLSLNPNKKFEDLIKREKPDLMLHPSVLAGVYVNDLVFIGNKFKIPVVLIMNSWDNPSSKRAVISNNYWLLVWGPQTKAHAIEIMNMSKERVIEFGAAQFDIYSEAPKKSKEEILSYHKVKDLNYPTLLYAGSSKNTNEFAHLRIIDDAICLKKIPKVNIIYRPHPWGAGGKDGEKFKNYQFQNVVIDRNMKSYLLSNKKIKFDFTTKYSDTRDILFATDAVISPLSTILIEAMIMGKAPLCFMPIDEKNAEHFQLARFDRQFEELLSQKEMIVVWGVNNLLNGIADLIKKIDLKENEENLQKSAELFVKKFDSPFKKRIIELIEKINETEKKVNN